MNYGRTAASSQTTISTTDKANGLSGATFLSRQTFARPIAMSLASRISVSPHPNKPFTFIPHHVWVPPGARSIYGGLVISQALCSSLLTVEPSFGLHSFHCYFLHPGLPDRDIEYRVDKLAEGKRYTRREVRGWQNGRMFFILLASYESPQGPSSVPSQDRTNVKVSHSLTAMAQPWDEDPTQKNGEDFEVKESFQVPFPKELRPWDQCEDNEDFLQRLLQEKSKEELGWKWELFDSWLQVSSSSNIRQMGANAKESIEQRFGTLFLLGCQEDSRTTIFKGVLR